MTERERVWVPLYLGLRLSDWHSSADDPVHAVSSAALADQSVSMDTFQAALSSMEASLECSACVVNRQELREIISAMKATVGDEHVPGKRDD